VGGGASPGPLVVTTGIIDGVVGNMLDAKLHNAHPSADSPPKEMGSSDTETASGTLDTQVEPELEADSPFDNDNFLSFEEWKKKNLVRAGQTPEGVGQGRAASAEQRARRRPVDVNALDSLGEESEIEIDFSGFGKVPTGEGGSGNPSENGNDVENKKNAGEKDNSAPSSWALSKDAGKTCKERFNYASFDCAATVLKTNSKAKSSSSVLVEHKDSYMLNECSAKNKFVIVEMCDDILVDTVVLANYEFFSSMFRHFRVSVSDRYPVKMERWRTVGTFEARNSRDIQPFLVTEPQIWARYLRIEFLTHYGNEYYCPLSLIRVHGTTMMEQFRRDEEEARGDDDFAEPIEAAEGEPVKTAVPIGEDGAPVPTERIPTESDKDADSIPEISVKTNDTPDTESSVGTPTQSTTGESQSGSSEPTPAVSGENLSPKSDTVTATSKDGETENTSLSTSSSSTPPSSSPPGSSEAGEAKSTPTENSKGAEAPPGTSAQAVSSPQSAEVAEKKANTTAASVHNAKASTKPSANGLTGTAGGSSAKPASNSTGNGSQAQAQVRSPSQTQPNPGAPTTQESFFKSIHKRLQHLEANSTLSLQYIEEQSRILRDAFIKVEKRQLSKTEKFLDHLNSTVMQELKAYRSLYDQMWQSTIMELESMKERQRSEIGEIGARLSLVADELVWQKRMAVVQSTLLLLCLGLVLFVRSGTMGAPSDAGMPIAQQIGHKYSQFFDSPPGTPAATGDSRRRRTFRNMWRSDTSVGLSDGVNQMSDAETDGNRSPAIEFSPPTPTTPHDPSHLGYETASSPEQVNSTGTGDEGETGLLTPTTETAEMDFSNQEKRIEVLETQSGPATPNGTRDSRPSWEEIDRAVDLLNAEQQGLGTQREQELHRKRQKHRSPLRRAESYDESRDSPGEDSTEEADVL
jgi:hypothetical protein